MKLTTAASVSRPDKHSIRTSVDKHRLGQGIRSSRWRVTASLTGYEAGEGERCRPGTSPGSGPYGTCAVIRRSGGRTGSRDRIEASRRLEQRAHRGSDRAIQGRE